MAGCFALAGCCRGKAANPAGEIRRQQEGKSGYLGDNAPMNKDSPTKPTVQSAEGVRDEAQRLNEQIRDPRRRLRELLAIPDRERTDAVWDEIVQLEIQLAPGNRAPSAQANAPRQGGAAQRQESGRRPERVKGQETNTDARPGKRSFKRRKHGPGTSSKT